MRIGFVSNVDPRDPGALSGMAFNMRRELARLGDVVDLTPFPLPTWPTWARLLRLAPARWRQACRQLLGRAERRPGSPASAAAIRAWAGLFASRADEQLARRPVDVLFGCCASAPLSRLETDVPIVYASDTTARLLLRSYPGHRARPTDCQEASELLEQLALRRAAHVVLATEVARWSAIDDYGVPAGRAHAVPMGANVAPAWDDRLAAPPPIAPPSRADLRLIFVGLDPERKRLDLAVEVIDLLRAAGWAARLKVVGQPTPRALDSPFVTCRGLLDPASPLDRRTHVRLLVGAHVLLLPSTAEAFGIAPCEAAHHGRPSVVSAVGGLPEVVLDGETGAVLPPDAGARDYALAVLGLVADDARYQRVSQAALRRAHGVLSWERWREAVAPIVASVAAPAGSSGRGAATRAA